MLVGKLVVLVVRGGLVVGHSHYQGHLLLLMDMVLRSAANVILAFDLAVKLVSEQGYGLAMGLRCLYR